jgi:hypothetical protein
MVVDTSRTAPLMHAPRVRCQPYIAAKVYAQAFRASMTARRPCRPHSKKAAAATPTVSVARTAGKLAAQRPLAAPLFPGWKTLALFDCSVLTIDGVDTLGETAALEGAAVEVMTAAEVVGTTATVELGRTVVVETTTGTVEK